jgi:hypothetical protein
MSLSMVVYERSEPFDDRVASVSSISGGGA